MPPGVFKAAAQRVFGWERAHQVRHLGHTLHILPPFPEHLRQPLRSVFSGSEVLNLPFERVQRLCELRRLLAQNSQPFHAAPEDFLSHLLQSNELEQSAPKRCDAQFLGGACVGMIFTTSMPLLLWRFWQHWCVVSRRRGIDFFLFF